MSESLTLSARVGTDPYASTPGPPDGQTRVPEEVWGLSRSAARRRSRADRRHKIEPRRYAAVQALEIRDPIETKQNGFAVQDKRGRTDPKGGLGDQRVSIAVRVHRTVLPCRQPLRAFSGQGRGQFWSGVFASRTVPIKRGEGSIAAKRGPHVAQRNQRALKGLRASASRNVASTQRPHPPKHLQTRVRKC